MTQSAPELPPTPGFPSWPFGCLNFYSHLAQDAGRYAEAATHTADPVEQFRAEEVYGASLFHDFMQAYVDLALAPFNLMVAAMTAKPADPAPPGDGAAPNP